MSIERYGERHPSRREGTFLNLEWHVRYLYVYTCTTWKLLWSTQRLIGDWYTRNLLLELVKQRVSLSTTSESGILNITPLPWHWSQSGQISGRPE